MSKKYCYLFTEGNAKMRELLGGKGANLAEMTNIGLPVPQGFTITTEACTQYYEDGRQINDEIMAEVMKNVKIMEDLNGKKFGDLTNPLLVSVRSGARASMPGMMDTILNLGLNDDVVAAMIKGNPDPKFERFVYDSYRRFIQMFSDVVMEVGKKYFEQLIDAMKERKGVKARRQRPQGAGRRVQGRVQKAARHRLPLRPCCAAEGSHPRRVPLLGQPPRQRLSP